MRYLIYDGDCPFCTNYVGFLNLKRRFPDIELLDAREHPGHEAVQLVRASGKLLDDGMALVDGNGFTHGAEVMQILSQGTAHGTFFQRPKLASFNYRLLLVGRRLTLKLLGRKKLGF